MIAGWLLVLLFAVWTILIRIVDVQSIGPMGTDVGFAGLNRWFHRITGVHWGLYTVTDWLGLVPVSVCLWFGGVGLVQLVRRKGLLKVDADLLLLGIYYVVVFWGYLLFEMIPINYRPVLVEGRLETSYPSSTTLLVMSVMPTFGFQMSRRLKNRKTSRWMSLLATIFSLCMVMGRLLSGVHWLTDIIGAILLSNGLFYIYKAAVLLYGKEK